MKIIRLSSHFGRVQGTYLYVHGKYYYCTDGRDRAHDAILLSSFHTKLLLGSKLADTNQILSIMMPDSNISCFAGIIGVGVMLTLILVPLSFSYVE